MRRSCNTALICMVDGVLSHSATRAMQEFRLVNIKCTPEQVLPGCTAHMSNNLSVTYVVCVWRSDETQKYPLVFVLKVHKSQVTCSLQNLADFHACRYSLWMLMWLYPLLDILKGVMRSSPPQKTGKMGRICVDVLRRPEIQSNPFEIGCKT